MQTSRISINFIVAFLEIVADSHGLMCRFNQQTTSSKRKSNRLQTHTAKYQFIGIYVAVFEIDGICRICSIALFEVQIYKNVDEEHVGTTATQESPLSRLDQATS